MQTSFAEIENMVEDRLSAVEQNPNVPLPTKVIAGFAIPDTAGQQSRIAARQEDVRKFQRRRTTVIDNLTRLGVTPLAVIPSKVWAEICQESNLYRFKPRGEKVSVSTQDAETFHNLSLLGSWMFAIISVVGLGLLYYSEGSAWWSFNSIFAGIGIALCFCFVSVLGYYGQRAIHLRWFDRIPHEKLVRRLLPDMKSYDTSDRYGVAEATLVLPSLPDDLIPVLQNVSGLLLCVAAVPEAFKFAEKPSQILQKRLAQIDANNRAFFEDMIKPDPIIYTDDDHVVAIIAQFGEFPVEREAVIKALEAEDNLL